MPDSALVICIDSTEGMYGKAIVKIAIENPHVTFVLGWLWLR